MITDKIDKITGIPAEYLRNDPPAPRSVKIEISPRCNFRCSFCTFMERPSATVDMDFGLFRKIADDLKEIGVEEVGVFYIGESFMNPALLVDCISYLKKIGIPYVFLTSNASLATPRKVETCMKAGLDSLKWSINAENESQFKNIMGVSEKLFHKSIDNVKSAWAIRTAKNYNTKLYASSIKYDGEQQVKMEKLLEEHILPYVDEHYWLPLYSLSTSSSEREMNLGFKPSAGNQGRLGSLRDPVPCWSLFTEGHIISNGKMSICCVDTTGEVDVGDLNKQSFMEAWNCDTFKKLRSAHLKKEIIGTTCEACLT